MVAFRSFVAGKLVSHSVEVGLDSKRVDQSRSIAAVVVRID